MHTIRPRRVAALLAVLALLLTALPAVAAPDRPMASEDGVRVPLLHTVAAWLAALWPDSGPPAAPQAVWEALGSAADPGGAPEPANSVPTATPQLGSGLDPDG